MKVAILGAAGLVGSALTQRLLRRGDTEVRACVRNPTTSWPLMRLGIELVATDLRDEDSVRSAVTGCTHVVNCALGEDRHLIQCMQNLVRACDPGTVRRLVHLSSVTVYGDPPRADCRSEAGTPRPKRHSYGWYKLKQDEIALRAHQAGLSTAVLCLPHVTGPNSRFMLGVLRELSERRFAYINGGRHPLVVADVVNVCQAIELALDAPTADGQRIFINDGGDLTWKSLVERVAPMASALPDCLPDLPATALGDLHHAELPLREALRLLLLLPEVKAVLRRTRLARNDGSVAHLKTLLKRLQSPGASRVLQAQPSPARPSLPSPGLWRQQSRTVRHEIDRARSALGFTPEVSTAQSMDAFERWYRLTHQFGTPYWDLARRI